MNGMSAVCVLENFGRGVGEGFEASDENGGKFQEAFGSGIVFVVAAHNLLGQKFAEKSAGKVHGLMVRAVGLLADELCAVD